MVDRFDESTRFKCSSERTETRPTSQSEACDALLTANQQIGSVKSERNIHVNEFIERKSVKFLLNTSAEVTVISNVILAILPKTLRTVFQDNSQTLKNLKKRLMFGSNV
jgi:hypothetical protein